MTSDDRNIVFDWLNDPKRERMCFTIAPSGNLMPFVNFPGNSKSKICYFVRKGPVVLTPENMRESLIYGDTSPSPINDLSAILDDIVYPILSNPTNTVGWPEIIKKDVDSHVQELRNIIAEVKGSISNQTVLPMPIAIERIFELEHEVSIGNIDVIDIKVKNSLEGIVIKWHAQIDKILKDSSANLFNRYLNPTPMEEIKFWNKRRSNISNIYDQLTDPRVKSIGNILEMINSVYTASFFTTFKDVVTALHEADDVTLWLKPLEPHFERFEREEFIENTDKLEPLYHVVCLIWAHSKYYGSNNRMIVLFKMINNMMIECSSKFLDPGSIFQGEPDESLAVLNKVIAILEEHKACFILYREKLPSYALPEKITPMWTFMPKDIFERFDKYLRRLYKIQAIFETANEFYKIEKLELGGLRGRGLSRTIQEINSDFKSVYVKWTQIQFDPLEPSSKEFEIERRQFERESEVLERKLSSVLVQEFEECHTLEAFIKFIQVCGTLLLRPLIFNEVKEKLNRFVTYYLDDLDLVKEIFDNGLEVIEKHGINKLQVDKGFPPVAGTLTWIKRLKRRITRPMEELPYIEIKSIFEMSELNNNLDIVCGLLDNLEIKVYNEWKQQIPIDISVNMEKFLLVFESDGLLKVNFDIALVTALKEIRMLKALGKIDIPDIAIELHENTDSLWRARVMLSRIVDWYNEVKLKVVPCEFDIIKKEFELINNKLLIALETAKWSDYEEVYIMDLHGDLQNLNERVLKAKGNVDKIIKSLKTWGDRPMYVRQDSDSHELMYPDKFDDFIKQRQHDVMSTKQLIDEIVDENFRLFFNLPLKKPATKKRVSGIKRSFLESFETLKNLDLERASATDRPSEINVAELDKAAQASTSSMITLKPVTVTSSTLSFDNDEIVKTEDQLRLYRAYEEHLDILILKEIQNALHVSLSYMKIEMENRMEKIDAPLFEVKLELQEPILCYFPAMDSNLKNIKGFLYIITTMIANVFNMTDMIPMIAQPPELDRVATFEYYLERFNRKVFQNAEFEAIDNIQMDIMQMARDGIKDAQNFLTEFDKYSFLWLIDKKKHLSEFLKYGRHLTKQEQEEIENGNLEIKEQAPQLNDFKDIIEFYDQLYNEIEKIDDLFNVNSWLRVNLKGLKYSLLNSVSKWSYLFKEYLRNKVIDDLIELEDFIRESSALLEQEPTNEDYELLLKILKTLSLINERERKTDEMFEPLKKVVDLLKTYDVKFDDRINDQFAELPEKWITLKKLGVLVKQSIGAVRSYQVDLIKKRILMFDLRTKLYHEKFMRLPFFNVPCDRDIYELCDVVNTDLTEMEQQLNTLKESAIHFQLTLPDESKVLQCRKLARQVKNIWDFMLAVSSCIDDWKITPWKKINVEDMENECKRFSKEMRGFEKETKTLKPYIETEAMIKNLLTSLRAIIELQNPAIRERHWVDLMYSTKVRFEMTDKTTLAQLLDLQLHRFEEEVKNIVDKSVKEMAMEKNLNEINSTWKSMKFSVDIHERTKIKVIRVREETLESLEENQVQLQNMLSSKFVGYFLTEVTKWQTLLSNADQVISSWLEVQRKWMYLESIFIGSEDIRSQLPQEAKRFEDVDRTFKSLLNNMMENLTVVDATNKPGLFDKLDALLRQLVLCEKALNDYLETKRLAYPRFYFVSSADLLDILSNGNVPERVAKHLTKLYDSIAKLIFKKGTKIAEKMFSKENDEIVPFYEPCDCSGKVEIWLNRLTDMMRKTLHILFRSSVIAYEEKSREVWVFDWPAQTALCTTQIWWTTEVNIAFTKLEEGYENSMRDYQKKQISQLNSLIELLLGDLIAGDRQKIMTICTIDVHSRDVVAKMILQKVDSSNAFQWQSQLRHRWDKEFDDCFANICDAQFRYDYEYLGNTPRLVITPLTDRCYITLTQSLHLIMGGAPAGPAGTGKTETTKDLGRALGIMVYVFNCSEQMDYKSCGNIYKGLAQTGAWGCFDEFNRISVEVLSVIAVQVKTIQDAMKTKKKTFNFMGETITLVPTIGLFITMNPGYAGRAELPENLKALFRPCAMVVPDFELICEIMLVAEGFQEARLLARKFITLYTLCRELLSKQDHYDWGLRAIKSVLVVAGGLKRADRQWPEDQVLMRALRDFNVPKIVTADMEIFLGLIGDLFPALDVPRKANPEFEAVIRKSVDDLGLQYGDSDGFILKVVQLDELFAVRHSVFIVGNAGTGKSQVWKTLFKTYMNQKRRPLFNDLNPKAVTNDELFGVINPSTREWRDGLFSNIMREQANISNPGPKWIVLDGDIDPMWIESLNTVMDDNKVLTLASNERIALTKEMRLLFEISNLKTATPATVSRAGILYINPQDLGWSPFVTSWTNQRTDPQERKHLEMLFSKYFPILLENHQRFKKITPVTEIAMIQMTCFLLDCLLTPQNIPPESSRDLYEQYFCFASIWGFGSACFQDQLLDWRNEFSKMWTGEFKDVKFPPAGTVFSYYIDSKTKEFCPWSDLVGKYEMDPDIPLQSTLVPTADTTRLRYFMDMLIDKRHPVMLVGGSGTGKSVIVSDKLQSMSDNFAIQNVPFNFYTTSEMLQKIIEKPLEKKAGRNYGPPGNKTMIYFIDDMNMPMVDNYGTVQAHTLIRQFFDYGHWYDRSKLTLKEIKNIQFVSSMNPTSGSFTINPRLQRHFCVFSVNYPHNDQMYNIYYQILTQHIANPSNKFQPNISRVCESLINAALNLHFRMSQVFMPTAIKFHYIFNLRDLANIFQGMLFSTGDTCSDTTQMIQLWTHEASRVYCDKLVDQSDIEAFQKIIGDVVKKNFEGVDDNMIFVKPMIYCHFAEGLQESKYMRIKEWPKLNRLLEDAQENYNELVGSMNLVFFEDAMAHICRISRILESPRGNALLIGVGGSGKQLAARLAAFISNLEVFQIQLRKGYALVDMKADLAALYLKAAIKNVPCLHLMTDSQVAEESYLVLINDMLASGEIAELFPDDEVDNICNGVRNELKQLGIIDTKENCWRYFIDKVRQKLKTVLCFSPVGSTLRIRARKFPAIVNCSSIDWFHEWPQNALESVSKRFLSEISVLPAGILDSVSVFMAHVHKSVNEMSQVYRQNEKRYNYTTPKSFLELISLFEKLLVQKNFEYKDRMSRLKNGLIKLDQCAEQAEELKKDLAVQEVELNIKNEAADELIEAVNAESERVQSSKSNATDKQRSVNIMKEQITIEKRANEEELRKAKPELDKAADALNTLNKNNLTELKSFGSPPDIVVKVCAAVLVLYSKGKIPKDRSWKQSKMMMSKVDEFLNSLINFDKDNIPPEVIKEVNIYMDDPEFDGEKIKSKSLAAAGLAKWVIGIVGYNSVYLIVEPKIRAVRESEKALAEAQAEVDELEERVNELERALMVIKAKQDEAEAEKKKCQDEADKTANQIDLAYRLVNGLQAEKVRWRDLIGSFQAKLVTLPGDILILSCFISYVGCFTRRYRLELLHSQWIPTFKRIKPDIAFSEFNDPLALICDDAKIAEWNNEGLPADRMSTENATILTNSDRWPLMIDPQLQAIKWIKQRYGDKLKVLRLSHKGYLDNIERAITNGDTLLIENIEETIDAVLDPLLGRVLIKKGTCIKIGDREIDYNKDFRLILQTKLANPHYKPEIQAQTTLINFTVTRDGLEEQLLAEVVKAERPDLEEQKATLTQEENSYKILLKQLEDDLLSRLSSAGENVLEDPSLVYNLEKTKKTSAEIETKRKLTKTTTAVIDSTRESYRPAAERASILYFILNDLYKINPIYQFSLKAFTVVFKDAIMKTPPSEEITTRVHNLIDSISYSVFMYTSRGLFERDKLTFLSQMIIQILIQSKEIVPAELDFLLRFPYQPNIQSPVEFLTNVSWGGIMTLSNMNEFASLDKDIEGSPNRWRKFIDAEAPENAKFPGEWKQKSALQRLCIMRCIRPDRMSYAMREFIREKLGSKYVESRTIEFAKSYEESSNVIPIFFILSPGVDPLKDVEKVGNSIKFASDRGNFHNVSLGQGQERVAEDAIDIAAKEGHWVILQNIHLVAKWLSSLEKKMEAAAENSHKNYRLFMSAEPAELAEYHIIPQGILESAIKITNEPPTGMRANMHKALDNFSQETLEMCSKESEFKAVLFSLCYFHAVVAERRKFGPQGWNRNYPFNVGDLTISVYVLWNYLEANSKVPWEDLRYLFAEIMYGGHITDDWDRRLCRTYLEEVLTQDLIDGDISLCAGFSAPPNLDYVGYHKYIDENMPPESPALYGLHPNAEIGFLTTVAENLFKTIFELQPRDSGASSGGSGIQQSREDTIRGMVDDLIEKLPEVFMMTDLYARTEDRSPFVLVAFQECERMNILITEIKSSLRELRSGLKGELTISPDMETLMTSVFFDKVPDSWAKRAYPSLLGLQSWIVDLMMRGKELENWSTDFVLPSSIWLAGFFNPQSFLTAIMQQTARKNEWPLDKMCLNCDVTKKQKDDFSSPPREGAYINSLFMEGARWDTTANSVVSARLKELFPQMPVIFVRAVTQDKQDTKNVYECPLYKTRQRGPTYVWTFNLKSKEKASKWTLGGVALLLQV
ncbi:dynein beta chain, ciliary-like [Chironomus tepperi]|uniref:dynein beta chain, ciliary-like n=1 Tax=Chironomus tepperi TaxID=113505 RepID=UPI00391F7289